MIMVMMAVDVVLVVVATKEDKRPKEKDKRFLVYLQEIFFLLKISNLFSVNSRYLKSYKLVLNKDSMFE